MLAAHRRGEEFTIVGLGFDVHVRALQIRVLVVH